MYKFSDIEQFRHIVKRVKKHTKYLAYEKDGKDAVIEYPIIDFIGTVKLHGTNSGIKRHKGVITAQSREREITAEDDNYGFAKFVSERNQVALNTLFDRISTKPDDIVTIYGEYIGKGIQKKVAISKLEKRQFVIFNVKINDKYVGNDVNYRIPNDDIYNVNDAGVYDISINFNNIEPAVKKMEELVEKVETCCPYGQLFDIDGEGEGICWVSKLEPNNSDLWFKTKGAKHKISGKQKNVVEIDPIKLESILNFVEYTITENRLQQGIEKVKELHSLADDSDVDVKHIGDFLKWVFGDVQKEEYDVMEENNLDKKDVSKPISDKAKKWFLDFIDKNT